MTGAFAHCTFIDTGAEAGPIFADPGLFEDLDDACFPPGRAKEVTAFVESARTTRFCQWGTTLELDAPELV